MLLGKVEPEDLISFGMIPEFVGRFNSIANCNELTIEDLVEILEKPKNAIVKQCKQLFSEEGIDLQFTPDSLRAMAERAKETGTGARVLRRSLKAFSSTSCTKPLLTPPSKKSSSPKNAALKVQTLSSKDQLSLDL